MMHPHYTPSADSSMPTGPVPIASARRTAPVVAFYLSMLGSFAVALVVFFMIGCAGSSRATDAPTQAREGLAKVGAAYEALAAAYDVAVELRAQACIRKGLGENAPQAERVKCMGPLGSGGAITLGMLEVHELYDEGAEILEQLAALLEQLTAELAASKDEGG